jgi:hypothetical protein
MKLLTYTGYWLLVSPGNGILVVTEQQRTKGQHGGELEGGRSRKNRKNQLIRDHARSTSLTCR